MPMTIRLSSVKTLRLMSGTAIGDWFDKRIPWREAVRKHLTEYYAPKNFNVWYAFGALALLVLVIQIVSGIFLTMSYKPDAERAFASVEYIMRDVYGGWLVRYFIPRARLSFYCRLFAHVSRFAIWLAPSAARIGLAFGNADFSLPNGGGLFRLFIALGTDFLLGRSGDRKFVFHHSLYWRLAGRNHSRRFCISDVTLNRFFALHVAAIPLIIVALVFLHIVALHQVGSNTRTAWKLKKIKTPMACPWTVFPFILTIRSRIPFVPWCFCSFFGGGIFCA